MQSIAAAQSFDFLILLLQNYGRGENSEILELALSKVKEKFVSMGTEVKDLRTKNEKLIIQNSSQSELLDIMKAEL